MEWSQRKSIFRYKKNGQEHIVWFLDGATLYNQLSIALDHGIKGVAISTLGYEEPSTWRSYTIPTTGRICEKLKEN